MREKAKALYLEDPLILEKVCIAPLRIEILDIPRWFEFLGWSIAYLEKSYKYNHDLIAKYFSKIIEGILTELIEGRKQREVNLTITHGRAAALLQCMEAFLAMHVLEEVQTIDFYYQMFTIRLREYRELNYYLVMEHFTQ